MSQDAHVKVYMDNLEMSIRQNLQHSWAKLRMETAPSRRDTLKTRINTLSGVLDQLHGKTRQEPFDPGEEETSLKEKLHQARKEQRETASGLHTSIKIIKDLKTQVHQGSDEARRVVRAMQDDNQHLLHQLRKVQKIAAAKLSMQVVINRDLNFKLKQACEQLQQQQTMMQGAMQPPVDGADLCGLWAPLEEATKKEKEEQEDMICISVSELKKISETYVSEIWEANDDTLRELRHQVMKLQVQLQTKEREMQQVLQRKEQERAQRVEEVSRRRSKRRNWFARMFTFGSVLPMSEREASLHLNPAASTSANTY